MGAALATRLADLLTERSGQIAEVIANLGDDGVGWAEKLMSGTMPQVSLMPEPLMVLIEDIYAGAIAHSFLLAVPFAVLSLLAVVFLPPSQLTRMTTQERLHAEAADLATVSVPEGMDTLTADPASRNDDDQKTGDDSAPARESR